MPESVKMPALGESVTEGTVTRWLKNEGERVEADEPLLEVSTDKVDTEIPSPASGVVSRILVPVDEVAEVGAELAIIDGGEGSEAATPAAEAPAAQSAPSGNGAQPSEPAAPAPSSQAAPSQAAPEPSAQQAAQAARDAATSTDAGTEVKLPALGESVTEGTITRWLKNVGDQVEADEPLLEISTDKVDTEIPSPAAGTLSEIRVGEDEVAEVGSVLAVIGGGAPAGAPAPSAPAQQRAEQETAQETTPAAPQAGAQAVESKPAPAPAGGTEPAPTPSPAASNGDVGYVTPLVRKLATEHGIDLSTLSGTGVGGRIRKQDVLAAAEAKQAEQERAEQQRAEQRRAEQRAAPAPAREPAAEKPAAGTKPEPSPLRGRTEKLSRMRSLIARRMVESLQAAAQLTTVVEVDVTAIARLRSQVKDNFLATHGVKLSFLPFFALATVEALRAHPVLNASIDTDAGTVTYHDGEHLGIAVDTERGLVVPVIRDAGDLSLAGLARRIADVAERTRTNKISPDELAGATFTLTNTGSRGALFDTPIFTQPQVGILGTGTVVKRAVVVDDPDLGELIVPRSMMYLALSYDHRLVDGADAMRFLTTIKDRLEAAHFESELGLT